MRAVLAGFFLLVLLTVGIRGVFAGTVGAGAAVGFMKLFGLLEFMAFARDTQHAERKSNQKKFHRGPSINTPRTKAIPKA
jgi:hypothetical protein